MCESILSNSMRKIETDNAPLLDLPFSQGIEHSDLIFLSGQVPRNPTTGEIVSGGVQAQTEQVMQNIEALLSEAGTSLDNAIKVTVFLTNIDDFDEFNETYVKFISEPYPARSAIEVSDLASHFQVEIELVAKK